MNNLVENIEKELHAAAIVAEIDPKIPKTKHFCYATKQKGIFGAIGADSAATQKLPIPNS